jgi:hypothetical protein
MEHSSWIFENWPKWLRWVLFPVVLVVTYFLGLFIVSFFFPLITRGQANINSTYGIALVIVLSIASAQYITYLILPRKKVIITSVLSLLFSIWHLIDSYLLLILHNGQETKMHAEAICGVIFLVVSIILFRNRKFDREHDQMFNYKFES